MKDAMIETNTIPNEIAERLARPCTGCFWFGRFRTGRDVEDRCAHPDHGGTPNPVHGYMDAVALAADMRAEGGACGWQARLLTPRGDMLNRLARPVQE